MQKPNPEMFLNVMSVFLNRMRIKSLIPIDYVTAKNEVYFDLASSVPEEQQEVFKKALDDFESITDIEEWYNDK